jgi:hypothetical protein
MEGEVFMKKNASQLAKRTMRRKEWFSGPAALLLLFGFAQPLVGAEVGTVGGSVLDAVVTTAYL